MGPDLEINIEWHDTDGDGSNCLECKEPIYGKMKQAVIFTDNSTPHFTNTFKYHIECYKPSEDD